MFQKGLKVVLGGFKKEERLELGLQLWVLSIMLL